MRWGVINPLEDFEEELRSRALAMIEVVLAAQDRGEGQPDGMFGSPLGILFHLARPEDAELLHRVLDSWIPRLSEDPFGGLFFEVVGAIKTCLNRTPSDRRCRAFGARFAEVFTDDDLPGHIRATAIRPFLDHGDGAPTSGRTEALVGLLRHEDLTLAGTAALTLFLRGTHGALVREIAASWPTIRSRSSGSVS
ncbi:hypothetical protein [Actinoalloteichus hymeniacidonis]|uniref:Uncharacterized protein n=1 Tax=Actinoalloteichus hymeniacidonis TaxID=340345 RepID=A0AAC9HQN0_9PSEU|nr:hypothetical protein [Actinoalloteichus hymeniacidonis]AOS63588.1 hypothetical protein TL08_13870 [Actinoalloteichus hymeniacidonis]MBB5908366.1 hypothetical protein [Actinoalloteichus hymeniacidonis]